MAAAWHASPEPHTHMAEYDQDQTIGGTTGSVRVDFEPIGRRGTCSCRQTLLQCAHDLGIGIVATCGGHGTCGRCRIIAVRGQLSETTSVEHELISLHELENGVRLACQAMPLSDCIINVPAESLTASQRIQIEGLQATHGTDPLVTSHKVAVSPADLNDLSADDQRILTALSATYGIKCTTVDLEVARDLPHILRSEDWKCKITTRGAEVVAVGPWPAPTLGLAVDLGTTKIAAYLLDLTNGETLGARGTMNPQIRYGEDVVARLTHALSQPDGTKELADEALAAINDLADSLTRDAGVNSSRILEVVLVGNTAMHHLLLRLPVAQLARAPYVPAIAGSLDIKARDLPLRTAKGAYLHLPPNIAGFVGADHVAMLIACGVSTASDRVLAIDIGTNTEVCLAADGRLTTVSCASGPAFEGGHIRDGMRAAPGAIEHVEILGNEVHLQIVDDAEPTGVCGSGILDALAQLATQGIVDAMGRLSADHPRIARHQNMLQFNLVTPDERGGRSALSVTQNDVRQLQLAKAAIASGIQALLQHASLDPSQLNSIIVGGAFGSYIDIKSAIEIGMLPRVPLERFTQVGNAAGVGAKMALVSDSARLNGITLAREARYLELATAPGFMKRFVDNTRLAPFTLQGG